MRIVSTSALLLVLCLAATPAFCQASDSLSFQGFVTTPGGDPINNAGIAITFKLYEGATEIWSETQPSVTISGGVFNVLLGSVTPLNTVPFNRPLLLGIKVGTDPEISPRTPLAAAPYAKAMPGLYTFYRDEGNFESYNVIGGGSNNFVGPDVVGAAIGGGGGLQGGTISVANSVSNDFSAVGGGILNSVAAAYAVVAGGQSNTATGGATWGVIGGGLGNTIASQSATVGGGSSNVAEATYSTVPGGKGNHARGFYSFAAGLNARAKHNSTFVWNDGTVDSLVSTGSSQFLINASGGVGIGTDSPRSDAQLDVNGAIYVRTATLLFHGTSASGLVGQDDGIRFRYFGDFEGDGDHLVFEKTDANQNNPDGGIVFVNTGADGVVETALQIHGSGSVEIPGNLTKGSGSFKIDHPLDPTNKYLYHSFVESPDMMNVYNGNAVLDKHGDATVELPAYFEALNRDFRYQLTCIGGFAPIFVSSKISDNRFEISGGQPGLEVSWQVTGIRKDPFAAQNPIDVEVDKAPHERGTYLHPEAYGRLAVNARSDSRP